MKMRFYSSVHGRAFQRPGKGVYIGCKQKVKGIGFVWDIDAVVAIPESEVLLNLRDFDSAVRRGDLKKRTESDFRAYRNKRDAEQQKLLDERDAARKKAAESANADDNTESEEG